MTGDDPLMEFLTVATVPRARGHRSGGLEDAAAVLATHPTLARESVHAAAALGDAAAVAAHLAHDPSVAVAPGGPHRWDPLTYLCFSRYLRLDLGRSDGVVRAAEVLLDAGADPNTGWYERDHQPGATWESALYGAAGVAGHAEVTRLLLERGGDPNDEETPYHVPERHDNRVLEVLVESGMLTADSLVILLLRKADWHDGPGIRYLLEHGADPNCLTHWRLTAFQQAVKRDNALDVIATFLDHGADPSMVSPAEGRSGAAIAARRGRADILALLAERGITVAFEGIDRLIAACAIGDTNALRDIAEHEPGLVATLATTGGRVLAEFAGVGNTDGVSRLLDLGLPITARFEEGDGYWDVARDSTALHLAAWRAHHATVQLLLERGAAVDARDGKGRTPLMLAIKACVDSYWTDTRSPASVTALLEAGATREGVTVPTGFDEVDALLS